ncbi:MAG TPA: hypothetical protein VMV79_07240 [Alphaproteobacteria bacterium]|nr:hypothetical protein [Alphaproteobacteria bacterium]
MDEGIPVLAGQRETVRDEFDIGKGNFRRLMAEKKKHRSVYANPFPHKQQRRMCSNNRVAF